MAGFSKSGLPTPGAAGTVLTSAGPAASPAWAAGVGTTAVSAALGADTPLVANTEADLFINFFGASVTKALIATANIVVVMGAGAGRVEASWQQTVSGAVYGSGAVDLAAGAVGTLIIPLISDQTVAAHTVFLAVKSTAAATMKQNTPTNAYGQASSVHGIAI